MAQPLPKSTVYFIMRLRIAMLNINRSASILLALLIFQLPVLRASIHPPAEIPQAILDALKTGNVSALSGFFNSSIELSIREQEDIYSRQQAELIIKDFFSKHVPSGFVILHKGGKEGSQYAIGNLTTGKGIFRVTILIKYRDSKPFIHQLRFE